MAGLAAGGTGGAAGSAAGSAAGNATGSSFMSSLGQKVGEGLVNNATTPTGPNTTHSLYVPQTPEPGFSDIIQGQTAQRLAPPLNFATLLEMANR